MKIITLLFLIFSLNGCHDKFPEYAIFTTFELNDSLKAKKIDFITKTMEATSRNLSTSDYEDPEDVIQELDRVFTRTYGMETLGLRIRLSESQIFFITKDKLDSNQLIIFNNLLSGKLSAPPQ